MRTPTSKQAARLQATLRVPGCPGIRTLELKHRCVRSALKRLSATRRAPCRALARKWLHRDRAGGATRGRMSAARASAARPVVVLNV